MFKKIIPWILLGALGTAYAAYPEETEIISVPGETEIIRAPQLSSQFYVGAAVGVGSLNGNYVGKNISTSPPLDEHKANTGGDSFVAGLVLGVQKIMYDGLYVALQVNGLYDGLNHRTSFVDTGVLGQRNHVVETTNNYLYGADIRIGKSYAKIVPYILAGVEAGKWKMTLENESLVSHRGILPLTKKDYSKNLVGPKAGFGLLVPVIKNVSLNLEYSYTFYNDNISKTLIDPITGFAWKHSNNVDQNMVLANLNYNFD